MQAISEETWDVEMNSEDEDEVLKIRPIVQNQNDMDNNNNNNNEDVLNFSAPAPIVEAIQSVSNPPPPHVYPTILTQLRLWGIQFLEFSLKLPLNICFMNRLGQTSAHDNGGLPQTTVSRLTLSAIAGGSSHRGSTSIATNWLGLQSHLTQEQDLAEFNLTLALASALQDLCFTTHLIQSHTKTHEIVGTCILEGEKSDLY
ncbi:hypothetical protein JAAARDRAFT_198304 [Jaapia argillacea MUCL 33604]|uniref:Uncharacterized protein n=1 Tax=Jaapia argillacea MUCL 33604 TaxID=933084 RepID=A0A067PC92_9AGAM|nr:hypothetical protein JAAARDRAFT_198304 [Jaapia argillacea MUCL 33604]